MKIHALSFPTLAVSLVTALSVEHGEPPVKAPFAKG